MNVDRRGVRSRRRPAPIRPLAALAPARAPARRTAAALALLAGLLAAGAAGTALAQEAGADPTTMTVEELERFIAEQKAALERVRENRDVTVEKAREVREALAAKEAERRAAEAELETLCRERDALEPGSLEGCLAQLEGSSGR